MSRLSKLALLLAMMLIAAACGAATPVPTSAPVAPTTAPAAPTALPPTAAPAARVPNEQVQARLDAAWKDVDLGNTILWKATYSPYFPSEWPPSKTTTWTMYAYAQGMTPSLADAVRISAAWARVERKAGEDASAMSVLLKKLDVVDTQGNGPLNAEVAAALAKRDAVTAYALKLTAAPAESDPTTADMRAFYREWLRANGAFTAQIKKAHEAFLAWPR